jgi:hypothetical protein
MSTALLPTASNPRNRRGQIFSWIGVAKDGDTEGLTTIVPISAQAGAPTHNAHVAGELYIRTDGTAAAGTVLYVATNTSGTWAPLTTVTSISPTAITLTDNVASALNIAEGANSYIKCVTTNGSESVTIGKPLLLQGGLAPASRYDSPTEQTGTGSAQVFAHSLGSTPSTFSIEVTSSPAGGYTLSRSADATNVTVTITSGAKFYVHALK